MQRRRKMQSKETGMHHRNADFELVRRTGTCATLATLTTIGLFSLVAHLMTSALDTHRSTDDGIRVMAVTVVTARRVALPVSNGAERAKDERPSII
jgi:hypothetical protein